VGRLWGEGRGCCGGSARVVVGVELEQVVRGAGEVPFAGDGADAAAAEAGHVLAGLELPEYRLDGAAALAVIGAAAVVAQAALSTGGLGDVAQIPARGRVATVAHGSGVFGDRCEQAQLLGVGLGERGFADVAESATTVVSFGRTPAADSCRRQTCRVGCSSVPSTSFWNTVAPTITCPIVTTAWAL
jgi:hypothetical protein